MSVRRLGHEIGEGPAFLGRADVEVRLDPTLALCLSLSSMDLLKALLKPLVLNSPAVAAVAAEEAQVRAAATRRLAQRERELEEKERQLAERHRAEVQALQEELRVLRGLPPPGDGAARRGPYRTTTFFLV